MNIKKKKLIAAIAAVMTAASALTGCGGSDGDNAVTESSSADGSYTTADVQGLLDNAPEETSVPAETSESVTFSTVTDVENEVDRAIYKTQITLPEGWSIVENSKDGKFYASNLANLSIQAQNFGPDAELSPLETLADSAAASIVIQNMYYQADSDFGEPQNTTVAGQPAIRYDYTVTAYIFELDDEGNKTGEKSVIGEYQDRLYVFYYGTDAYCLRFETSKENYDLVSHEFDEMIDSFSIAEDGTEGYEAASIYMSEYESYSLSVLFSQLDEADEAERAAEEAASASDEEEVINSDTQE
ncbi:MAG: hypothetical protein ACI4XF_00200 [Oscillospiraceae bacterium]